MGRYISLSSTTSTTYAWYRHISIPNRRPAITQNLMVYGVPPRPGTAPSNRIQRCASVPYHMIRAPILEKYVQCLVPVSTAFLLHQRNKNLWQKIMNMCASAYNWFLMMEMMKKNPYWFPIALSRNIINCTVPSTGRDPFSFQHHVTSTYLLPYQGRITWLTLLQIPFRHLYLVSPKKKIRYLQRTPNQNYSVVTTY